MAVTGDLSLKHNKSPESGVRIRSAAISWKLDNFVRHYWGGLWRAELSKTVAKLTGNPVMISTLSLRVLHHDEDDNVVSITDYGKVGKRVVTTTGVGFIVDAFQNLTEVENMKYHGFGTGGGAEATNNTALTTELTTEYATDNVRPTGSQTEGADSTVYRTVGTLDPDSAVAITEHGIFSQAATGGGVLLDKTLFSVVNVAAAGDTLEATYDLTIAAGG